MKISEKLSEIKQAEGQLMRLYTLRESVIQQEFKDAILRASDENKSLEELEKRENKFLEEKKEKIIDLNKKIDDLKSQLIEDKNIINKKNIEVGLDKDLIKMKYLRIELSKLMNAVKNERGFGRMFSIDLDVYEELGISERIKLLEGQKAKLESRIQEKNWTTEL